MTMRTLPDSLPLLPGVYLFKDKENRIIYVGKAKSIKKRVQSYFKNKTDWKIDALLQEYAVIDYVVTQTEVEALLLEAHLIKQHQPKFNVLLKSGQPFVYLLFTEGSSAALLLVRNKKQKGTYFGPILFKKQARAVFNYLLKTFKLESCNKKIDGGCLRFHMNLCAGTCKEDFDKKEYEFRLTLAKDALEGNYNSFLKAIKNQITSHNKNLEFEKAQHLTYYLHNLDTIFATLKTRFSEKKYEKDVFLATMPMQQTREPNFDLDKQLQKLLGISLPLITVDCFDISHFQSSMIVGSCIRFVHGMPDKDNFRRFAIKSIVEQNDYAALQEIVARRYKATSLPDLIVIDGGKGQRNAIKSIFPHANIVSLAKREERLFSDNHSEGIVIDNSTEVGRFFIALRDYAHHFAISYHRKKRDLKNIIN